VPHRALIERGGHRGHSSEVGCGNCRGQDSPGAGIGACGVSGVVWW